MESTTLPNFHSLPVQEALETLQTTKHGLSDQEATHRLEKFGPNEIHFATSFSYSKAIFEALKNPFSIVLIIATTLSIVSHHSIDAFVIIAVLIINISIEVYHKQATHRNIQLLEQHIEHTSTVIRNGIFLDIPSKNIVPGDIVILEEGDLVPADGRLIEVTNLQINESSLTGESVPVDKDSQRTTGVSALLDRPNMVWFGSNVTQGSGRFVVTETGSRTHFGQINTTLQSLDNNQNPFLEKISALSKTIGFTGLVIVVGIFFMQYGLFQANLQETIIFSLAVLVSIIPESLPTVVNITLARGAKFLAKEHILVKELSDIESIGSTSILITDKTGTLTENSMRVEHIVTADNATFSVTGFGWKSEGMFLCNGNRFNPQDNSFLDMMLDFSIVSNRSRVYIEENQDRIIGEPTEAALLVMAQKDGRTRENLSQKYTITSNTQFIHDKNILITVVKNQHTHAIIAIGAPETIWNISNPNQETKKHTETYAKRGLRTIAYAYKEIDHAQYSENDLHNFEYLGFVAMRDPIREGVHETILEAQNSGVRIIMSTGDHLHTAEYIGSEIGIITSQYPNTIDGVTFLQKTKEEQYNILQTTNVFARVTPETKLQITKLLQESGEIVTMVGDGINDTLALRQADVGVSMGKSGTDAARSASSIVLTDDNFKTVITAIWRGRHIFANIKHVSIFLLSTNSAEALVLIMVTLLGLPLPLIATQILLINLVTDGLGSLPFAFREPTTYILPKPNSRKFLTHFDNGIIISATIGMAGATLCAFVYYLDSGVTYAQTIAFLVLSLTQLGRIASLEPRLFSIRGFAENPWLWRALLGSFGIIIVVLGIPELRSIFQFELLSYIDYLVVIALSLAPLITVKLYKTFAKTTAQKYYA